jgi:electron transport complex protein RnfG
MKDIIKLGVILLVVCAVAGAALSLVDKVTKPRIEEQKRLILEQALTMALPGASKGIIEPVLKADTVKYYIGYKDSTKKDIAGYAFIAKEMGYSSEIETMVGVDTTGKILGIKIMQQLETPGLGSKVEEVKYGEKTPWFQQQFVDKKAEGLAVDKDGGKILSITGATISSRAVTNSIKKGLQTLALQVSSIKNNI